MFADPYLQSFAENHTELSTCTIVHREAVWSSVARGRIAALSTKQAVAAARVALDQDTLETRALDCVVAAIRAGATSTTVTRSLRKMAGELVISVTASWSER